MKDKINKNVRYVNKDFGEFRRSLINFVKNYFPNTYNDFNETSPGMMFLETAAYVGDVLGFYTDTQLKESLLSTVEEKINMYKLSQAMGYKPKTRTPACVDLDVYQLIPSFGEGSEASPDFRYSLHVDSGMIVSDQSSTVFFRTIEDIDFSYSSSYDPTEISVYSLDNLGNVEYYLLKKKAKAVSGDIKTVSYAFDDPKPYDKITLQETDVLEIIDINDSDGNRWYETQFLAQDLIPISVRNVHYNDPVLSVHKSSVPYLLNYKLTERRFITRLREDDRTEIQFGSGISSDADEDIVPNPMNVGIGLDYFERFVDLSIDPKNFLYTRTYGQAPHNTVLTVRYTTGGGILDNVGANVLTTISSKTVSNAIESVDSAVFDATVDTLSVNNPKPARGGFSEKPIESIRMEAMATFAAQNRAVTKEDYIVRCYSMPSKYGAIAKAYVEKDTQINSNKYYDRIQNPLGINLYVLAYDGNKNFTQANDALKFNLINYLKNYRIMTDSINIKDAYIINIGIDFEIVVRPDYNSNEVILKCINTIRENFSNEKMEISKPIVISDIICMLNEIEGVQSVLDVEITNLYDTNLGYSGNFYDVRSATRSGILFPSLDPSIFEIKYKRDIRGRVVDYV